MLTQIAGLISRGMTNGLNRLSPRMLRKVVADASDAAPDAVASAILRQSPRVVGREDPLAFASFARPSWHRKYSQLGQDLWALWENNEKRDGYFVEFGATDGIALSNTALLERDYGWTGILAEPNPDFHEALLRNRRATISTDCVYNSTGMSLPFQVTRDGKYSTLLDVNRRDMHSKLRARDYRSVEVRTISLNDLLSANGAPSVVDFLSIDTEGSEYDILSATDFSRWHFRCIAIEHNWNNTRTKIASLLASHGYQRRTWPLLSQFDDWYVSPEIT